MRRRGELDLFRAITRFVGESPSPELVERSTNYAKAALLGIATARATQAQEMASFLNRIPADRVSAQIARENGGGQHLITVHGRSEARDAMQALHDESNAKGMAATKQMYAAPFLLSGDADLSIHNPNDLLLLREIHEDTPHIPNQSLHDRFIQIAMDSGAKINNIALAEQYTKDQVIDELDHANGTFGQQHLLQIVSHDLNAPSNTAVADDVVLAQNPMILHG